MNVGAELTGAAWHLPAPPTEVRDVCEAGEILFAALLTGCPAAMEGGGKAGSGGGDFFPGLNCWATVPQQEVLHLPIPGQLPPHPPRGLSVLPIQNIGYELGENQRTAEWYRANHRTPWVARQVATAEEWALS